MNETDEMLEEILKTLERPANLTQKKAAKKSSNDDIGSLLADLKKQIYDDLKDFVFFPDKGIYICNHQVTQKEFEDVIGINPSWFQLSNENLKYEQIEQLKREGGTENHPVERVSWYDAIYFCNKKSIMEGLDPVYSVDRKVDVNKWGFEPCKGNVINFPIDKKSKANGYRLLTDNEWKWAAGGRMQFKYAGSDNNGEVAWYLDNSSGVTHSVMQKKPNEYGLYDMSGNIWEWCWEVAPVRRGFGYAYGGSYDDNDNCCQVESCRNYSNNSLDFNLGFRLALTSIN